MKVITDTNTLMSALIKASITRQIIFESGWDFYYPEIALRELEKYKGVILEKSGLTEEEYDDLVGEIFSFVRLVKTEELESNLENAKNVMLNIDPDDVAFVACALTFDDAVIWSDDSDFDKQDKVKVLKTKDAVEMLFNDNNL